MQTLPARSNRLQRDGTEFRAKRLSACNLFSLKSTNRAILRWTLISGLACLIVAAIIAGVAVWNLKPTPPAPVSRFVFSLPTGQRFADLTRPSLTVSRTGIGQAARKNSNEPSSASSTNTFGSVRLVRVADHAVCCRFLSYTTRIVTSFFQAYFPKRRCRS